MSRDDYSPEGKGDQEFIDETKRYPYYTDLASVESQRNDMNAQEFPEGPYGSRIVPPRLGKSTPWREDQRASNRFDYENRTLHAGLDRDYPGDQDAGNAAEDTFGEDV
ncbi:hypothetical protein FHS18_003776 [Paenibacillus phyllosphaerae]|uniref:Cytosolic protein n=1 Tax=Paenibacillus phyllosphaerae TaxID=274593 RepID=A0A7W5AZL7_9BACL|nr:hypothetical protein [Paenibacillus phyllosphaerae]MBB3111708.1 hypothetical protein [Paenibacillus phyllosphaerae]